MTQIRFYARGDAAKGRAGKISLIDIRDQPSVELIFDAEALQLTASNTDEIPSEAHKVLVDGVERYFWIEIDGQLKPRRDLRSVEGHDLRERDVRVITTDDARRYMFVADADLPREVLEAIPPGRRRARL